MKGVYGMLGLEYRDTDSEEEGGAKPTENIRQITDDFDNGKDEHGADGEGDDDYVVIDLGGKELFILMRCETGKVTKDRVWLCAF